MTRPLTTAPWFRKKRRGPPIVNSVYAMLSKRQRAYSVFQPAPCTDFPLFQVIRILPHQAERSNSPRRTQINLKATFERLSNNPSINGQDRGVIDAFLKEFNRTAFEQSDQMSPEVHHVSEESLCHAGVNLSTATGVRAGFSFSRTRTNSREIRLQRHFSEAYAGGSELHTLIRRHAQPVFRLILQELHGTEGFPSAPGERGLLAIVTTRIVSTIGLHTTAETRASVAAGAGDEAGTFNGGVGGESRKRSQGRYEDLYGVSGLRFIVFPIECIEEGSWRVYGGISVCDSDVSEDDDTFTEDTRNNDSFYRAQKWVLGEAELRQGSNSTTVQGSLALQERSLNSWISCPEVGSIFVANNEDDGDRQASLSYVDVSLTKVAVPCVEVDIRPLLNEFAQKQCRLGSYYRKTASGDSERLNHGVNLLRRALRIFCFESTVRALYDLSGCYLHGLGVNLDFGTAKLLRYCASGLRRNYESRAVCLNRLALEVASDPTMPIERRIISVMLFSPRTLTFLSHEWDNSGLGGLLIGITLPSDIAKQELGAHYSCPASSEPWYVTSRRIQSLLHEDSNKVGAALEVLDDREFQDTAEPGKDDRRLMTVIILQGTEDHYRALLEGMDSRELQVTSQPQKDNRGIRPHFDKADEISPMELDGISRDRSGNAKSLERRRLEASAVYDESESANTTVVLACDMRGVGKTSFLKPLCSIEEINRRLRDGVGLMLHGTDVTQVKLPPELKRIVERAVWVHDGDGVHTEQDCILVLDQVRSWFSGAQCLFLIDDSCENQEISSETMDRLLALHQSGSDSKLLFTPRMLEVDKRAKAEPSETDGTWLPPDVADCDTPGLDGRQPPLVPHDIVLFDTPGICDRLPPSLAALHRRSRHEAHVEWSHREHVEQIRMSRLTYVRALESYVDASAVSRKVEMRTIIDGMRGLREALRVLSETDQQENGLMYLALAPDWLSHSETVRVWDVRWTRSLERTYKDRKRTAILGDGHGYEVRAEWDNLSQDDDGRIGLMSVCQQTAEQTNS